MAEIEDRPGGEAALNAPGVATSPGKGIPLTDPLLHLLLESAPVMMYLSDASGRITFLNKPVLGFFGGTSDSLPRAAWAGLVHPDDLDRCIRTHLEAAKSQQGYEMECRARREGGEYRWLLARAAPVHSGDGTFVGLAGAVADITEQRMTISALGKAEAALRASESGYRIVADNTYDWEFWIGPDGRFLYSSPSCKRITGRDAAEFAADQDLLHRIIHPEDQPSYEAHCYEQTLQATVDDLQLRICLPDGTIRWVAHACQPVYDDQGRFIGTRGSNRDITIQKKAEDEVRRLRQALSHVSRVNAAGQLTALIAHEINQPLAAILSNAQAALRHMSSNEPDLSEVREILSDIVSDDQRAGEVIRRLRGMLENRNVNLENLDMNELILEVVQLVRHDTLARDISIALGLEPNLKPVRGDRIQLQQVVLNLIANAIEAMKDNPVQQRKVTLQTSSVNECDVMVTVADLGPGIGCENLGMIFEPFFSGRPGGMGIGLAICRTIVEAHGGRIWATSDPGQGAIFRLVVPQEGITLPGANPAAD
jgi:PAS domain S-box-containing protein